VTDLWTDLPSFFLLAQSAAPTIDAASATTPIGPAPAPGWFTFLTSFGPIIFILLLFYFFIISAKRKDDRKRKALLDSIKKGDRVQTVGGMIGPVTEVKDDRIQIKIDENANVKVWFTRVAVIGKVEET